MATQKVDQKEPLEGLSLSFCIKDIQAGRVKEDQVTRIVASTNAPTREAFEEVLTNYASVYWRDKPEEAKSLARRFFEAGKIDQPRTRGEEPNMVGDGHWRNPGKKQQFNVG